MTYTSKQSVLIVLGIIKHIFSKSNYLVSKPGRETFVVVIVKYSFWDEDLLEIMAVYKQYVFSCYGHTLLFLR